MLWNALQPNSVFEVFNTYILFNVIHLIVTDYDMLDFYNLLESSIKFLANATF